MSGWEACGMDREFIMCPNEKYLQSREDNCNANESDNVVYHHFDGAGKNNKRPSYTEIMPFTSSRELSQEVQGTTELPFLTVVHVKVNSGSRFPGVSNPTNSSPKLKSKSTESTSNHTNSGNIATPEVSAVAPLNQQCDDTEAFGVTCRWKMQPSKINR